MDNKKQLTVGALLSYGTIGFSVISGLLYTPWMIRTIGDDRYGLYMLALSVVNVFLIDFGIGSAVTKFLSNYYARGRQDEADRFLGMVYQVLGAVSVGIALCLTVFYSLIDRVYIGLAADELIIFKRLFVMAAAYSVLSFPFTAFNGVLMANERFIEVKACDLGQKILSVGLAVPLLAAGQGVYALLPIHALSGGICLLVKHRLIRKRTGRRARFGAWDRPMAKSLLDHSLWTTVMQLAHRCMLGIMPTVIGAVIGSAEVTVFSLAATLEGYVYTFGDAVNGMFMPEISRLLAGERGDGELSGLMTDVGKFHVCTIGLILIGFACVGKEFIDVWMGPGYRQVYRCALMLMLPSLLSVPQQAARTALTAKGRVKEQALVYGGAAVLNLLLSLVLLPVLGVFGAALSICAACLTRTVGMNLLYRRELPVKLGGYVKAVYGRWSLAAVLTLGAGMLISRCLPLTGWPGVILKAVLICVVYGVLLMCFDRAAVRSLLRGIRNSRNGAGDRV